MTSGVTSNRDEAIPFDNIRRRTAAHMVRSKATSAHVYTSIEVDYERVERVRKAHQAEWKAVEGFSLTYLPFIARAFSDTVRDFPRVNASVGDDALIVHHDVHLSVRSISTSRASWPPWSATSTASVCASSPARSTSSPTGRAPRS
jgi:2-oxoglutarate dehydrogenase E2 component (dihydrolipoamide succinyltransferase)